MKRGLYAGPILGALLLAWSQAAIHAQTFSVPWYVVAGGGGTATNGAFSLSGTAGQWDASQQPLTNGLFSLTGGYWSRPENSGGPLVVVDSEIVVAIKSPTNNALTFNSVATIQGTIKGAGANTKLELTVNSSSPVPATLTGISRGILSWFCTTTLAPGANVITAQAVDTTNVETGTLVISTPAVITVFYGSSPPVASDKSTLLVSVSPSGHGKISGQSSGASLEVNKVYTVKATPVGNWIFTNWTVGSSAAAVLSSNACLSFIMTPGLTLRANFIQNPFPSLSGVYNGLFSPSAGTGEASSGAIVVTLAATSRGAYTARLMLDGSSYSFSGGFDLPGDSEVTVVRPGKPPVGVILHINTDLSTTDNLMTGYVVNFASSGWISPVLAERAVFSASNPATSYSGKHTLIILPGRGAPANTAGGYGYATLDATSAGLVSICGNLADKTSFSQSTGISKSGNVPVYVSLYSHKGSLQGWLTLTNPPGNPTAVPMLQIVGDNLSWFKPVVEGSMYAAGFCSTNLCALGSLYTSQFVLANAQAIVAGGNLPAPLIYSNMIVSGKSLSSTDPTIHGVIAPATGVLTLTFTPVGGPEITGKGVVLQYITETNAAGWFPGASESGSFLICPSSETY